MNQLSDKEMLRDFKTIIRNIEKVWYKKEKLERILKDEELRKAEWKRDSQRNKRINDIIVKYLGDPTSIT